MAVGEAPLGFEFLYEQGVVEACLTSDEKNSLGRDELTRLSEFLGDERENPDVKAVLITSGNPTFFTNGLAPEMFVDISERDAREAAALLIDSALAFLEFPNPIICCISGHCAGAGVVFAILTDYRLMVEGGARIGFPESRIGMNFPSGVVPVLRDLIGAAETRDALYRGKMYKPAQALEIRLVDEIHPADELLHRARRKTQEFANLPATSRRGIRTALTEERRRHFRDVREFDIEETARAIISPEAQEGFRSILENRRPRFPSAGG